MQDRLPAGDEQPGPPRRKPSAGRVGRRRAERIGPFLLNQIYVQDCVAGIRQLEADSMDIAIADPPYNLSKGGTWKWDNSVRLPGFGGDWSKVMADWDDLSLADYLAFTLDWLSELKRVVKPSGSLWLHGTYHNMGIINFALQMLQIEIINEVVWYKRNSFPNLSGRRLTASHETILWAHTGGPKRREYYFDYDAAKELVCPEDGLKEAGKQMRTVWDIPNNKRREEIQHGRHPTQKPLRLLDRMLRLSAREGDLLLVPFAGSGSECVAARKRGIRFLGFETDAGFAAIGRARLGLETAPSEPDSPPTNDGQVRDPSGSARTVHSPRASSSIPSLIKWTGSKRSQARAIARQMPPYRRYFEPFLGGGAVLYLAAVKDSVASDIYSPLIDLWRLVQSDPETLISDYERQWKDLQAELDALGGNARNRGAGVPEYFYRVRQRFNHTPNPVDLNFLLRTCVNGIVRFNGEGAFNNSFHLSRRGMAPPRFAAVVRSWHKAIQGVSFLCQDYTVTVAEAGEHDFVYFDPPYAGNRQRYVADLDLDRFFGTLESLNARGVRWALSFDGRRGDTDLTHEVPRTLYRRQLCLSSGNSAVNKVLNGPVEKVQESLYLNY